MRQRKYETRLVFFWQTVSLCSGVCVCNRYMVFREFIWKKKENQHALCLWYALSFSNFFSQICYPYQHLFGLWWFIAVPSWLSNVCVFSCLILAWIVSSSSLKFKEGVFPFKFERLRCSPPPPPPDFLPILRYKKSIFVQIEYQLLSPMPAVAGPGRVYKSNCSRNGLSTFEFLRLIFAFFWRSKNAWLCGLVGGLVCWLVSGHIPLRRPLFLDILTSKMCWL